MIDHWTFTSRVVRPDDVVIECTVTVPGEVTSAEALRDGGEIAQMGATHAARVYQRTVDDERRKRDEETQQAMRTWA